MDAANITAIAAIIAAIAGPVTAWIQGNRTLAKVAVVEEKMDGPLTALIAAIRAEAEVKIAIAQEETRRAFRRGQDQPKPPDPVLTAAIATEAVRVATDAATPPT